MIGILISAKELTNKELEIATKLVIYGRIMSSPSQLLDF